MDNERTETPLETYGRLYRDADGHEVWRIVGTDGRVVADGVASDHDAEWIATQVADKASR